MGYVFPTLMGLFLVIPLLFILNRWLRLSQAGIVVIALFSGVLVLLLLFSEVVFPMWQGLLLILLLALCMTYLLQQKAEWLFAEEEEELALEWETDKPEEHTAEEAAAFESDEEEVLQKDTEAEHSYLEELFQRHYAEQREEGPQ
ncbi:hypothetical protein [Ectobacillus ponti]|uniref:Uncharacterized protein n=1 Tax=Ectobacillus ponti TaxID=2961894 RepID=A0AA41X7V8_9BACI|nr:hypothetical protein [Ectobacillus ponti]MCP8968495.1 hypothetical protein [Ectobacillus ponti]